MQTAVIKRSIVLDGHKTSVSLENEFWLGLREIAARKNTALSLLIGKIDRERSSCNLSSAIRVHVFNYFRAQIGRQENSQENRQENSQENRQENSQENSPGHLDADVPLMARPEMTS